MTTHRTSISALLLVFVLVALAAYQAGAQRAVAPAPPVLATVRIETLFDGLTQRAEAKAEIHRMETDIATEQARREDSLRQKEQDLENIVAAAQRAALTDEMALEQLKYQYWHQQVTAEMEVEKALRLQELYTALKEAIRDLAETEGYDLVIVNDESDELNFDREARVPAQVQVLQQVTNRKILYLNEAIDITEDLIQRMNNTFQAEAGAPAESGNGGTTP